jgi:hypothetical protein
MKIMKDKRPTYTLWNGPTLIATFDHTREGMDAAMERAFELGLSAAIYSSRDDLVWSARDNDNSPQDDEVTEEQLAEMDAIYEEFNN